jgi:hypothetical protein
MMGRHLFAAALGALLFASAVAAAPPQVAKAAPDDGDAAVDPATTEIVVTFDQAMSPGGMSVVGGGEAFPEITDRPSWRNARTFVIPVKLQPDHDYRLSINSDRFTNFKNAAGDSAVPYPIAFHTAGAAPPAAAGRAPRAAAAPAGGKNSAAVDKLIDALLNNYSHRERLGLDWQALIDERRETLASAATPGAFAFAAMKLLAQAEDKHILVEANGKRAPAYVNPVRPNVNPQLRSKVVPNWQALNGEVVAMGQWPDGVGYLAIDSLDPSRKEQVRSAFQALWELHDAPALIVDLRLNSGGDERLAREIAGCFLDEPAIYAVRDAINPFKLGEFSPPEKILVAPQKWRPRYRGRVAVLTGPAVISSAESFVLMLKQIPSAALVGAPTQGSSGNPQPHDLGNGVTVYLPSWREMLPDGTPLEGRGITPDVVVDATPEDFADSDPVIDAALAKLRQ